MGSLGNGGVWGMGPFHDSFRRRNSKKRNASKNESKPSNSVDSGGGYQFPLKQAATAASLCLTGDTIAQLRHRWVKNKAHSDDFKVRILILCVCVCESFLK